MNAQVGKPETAVTKVTTAASGGQFEVIVEEPIAISFNGTTAAVMMGTPSDLKELAYGFALTEGYINSLDQVESFDLLKHANGHEAQFWVNEDRSEAIAARRRTMAGPVGCGLCGIDSLEQAMKSVPQVAGTVEMTADDITQAMTQISDWQPLKQRTRSTHAAGFYIPGRGIQDVREDVGRHNALDKLVGAMMLAGKKGTDGVVVVTSRISLELVQKSAILGSPMLIAASGPTSLAIETARNSKISLIGYCRGGAFEVFC